MEPATAEMVTAVATDAIKILGPVIVTAWVTYKVARAQIDLERVRVHEKDRIEAYKHLFSFAKKLQNRTFPLAEGKKKAFIEIMSNVYLSKLDRDLVYFGEDSLRVLDTLESQYVCMTDPDLIPEMNPDEETKFLENELFQSAPESHRPGQEGNADPRDQCLTAACRGC